ncbi:hypothetical protein DBR06_SOUSAS2810109, partial [Sousa chinensis]
FNPFRATEERPWGWNTSFPRDKVLHSCAGFIASCGIIFLRSGLNACTFVLPKLVRHRAPGQPSHHLFPVG